MRSAPTLAFDLAPSRLLGAGLAVIGVAASLAPWATAWPWPACAALSLLAAAGAARAGQRFATPRFRRIAWRAAGWDLLDADGVEHPALLLGHARLGSLIALDFRCGPATRWRALLTVDNSDAETRRRLILLLARGEVVQRA
jgi:toxin CptA